MPQSNILIIDDNKSYAEILAMNLIEHHFHVTMSYDGLDGLYMAKQNKPDLIILDLLLPGIDGYKVCYLLKNDKRLKQIPVIVISSRNTNEDEEKVYSLGADAFMAKPTDVNKILEMIRRFLYD